MNPNAKGNKSAVKPKAKPNAKATEKTARAISATAKAPAAPKVKVSPETIALIKKMGMSKALKEIKALGQQSRLSGPKQKDMAAEGRKLLQSEFATGVKRMYGERRFGEAAGKNAPAPKASTKYSPAPYKPKPKSGGSSSSSKVK